MQENRELDVELFLDITDSLSDGAFFAMMGEMNIDPDDLLEVYDEIERGETVRWQYLQFGDYWVVYSADKSMALLCTFKDQAVVVARVLNQNHVTNFTPDPQQLALLRDKEYSRFDVDEDFGEGIDL